MPTFDGAAGSIHYERWAGDSPPNCIVVIVHGYAEYAARYGHLAERLVADGAVVYGQDHMGHGTATENEPSSPTSETWWPIYAPLSPVRTPTIPDCRWS